MNWNHYQLSCVCKDNRARTKAFFRPFINNYKWKAVLNERETNERMRRNRLNWIFAIFHDTQRLNAFFSFRNAPKKIKSAHSFFVERLQSIRANSVVFSNALESAMSKEKYMNFMEISGKMEGLKRSPILKVLGYWQP